MSRPSRAVPALFNARSKVTLPPIRQRTSRRGPWTSSSGPTEAPSPFSRTKKRALGFRSFSINLARGSPWRTVGPVETRRGEGPLSAFSPDAHLAFHPRHLRVKCRVGPRARCVSFSLSRESLTSVVSRKARFSSRWTSHQFEFPNLSHAGSRFGADLWRSRSREVNHREPGTWRGGRFPGERDESLGGLAREVQEMWDRETSDQRQTWRRSLVAETRFEKDSFVFELGSARARAHERTSAREWRERC